ncbi:MAG: hypothetical protein KBT47_02570 [Armatimonadetes bacterium]|nr:hypothetical protein [Candidatus Hippobium faecium]
MNTNMLISWSLAVFAFVLALCLGKVSPWLKFIAMALGSAGDMCLAHYGIFAGMPFVIGAGFFALGHIFYIWAFFREIRKKFFNPGFFMGLVAGFVFLLAMTVFFFFGERNVVMFCLSLCYGLIILFLCSVVFAYAYENKKSFIPWLNVLGILFFIFSDFLIGINISGGIDFPMRGKLIWIFYPVGQFFLII